MSDLETILENKLLSALSSSTCEQLLLSGEVISLTSGQIVHQAPEVITEVYFPTTAIFSNMIEMTDGMTSEVALVGKEGLVGLSAILGTNAAFTKSIVRVSGTALKLPTEIIKQEFQRQKKLQQRLLLYTRSYLAHLSHIAACNSLHSVEQRFAWFLLLVHDCTTLENIPLTQKTIALMLGVRRASVTETAIALQTRKTIEYSRGKIIILDRTTLEAIACECYGKIRANYVILGREN